MKVTVDREALVGVVAIANLTTIKDASSIFSHLLFEHDTNKMVVKSTNQMTTTSNTLFYKALEDAQSFTLEAEPFAKWLATTEGDEVVLVANTDNVEATCGRSVSYFRTMRPSAFPAMTDEGSRPVAEINAAAMLEMLEFSKHGLPDTSGDAKFKEHMKLVRFRENSAVATDSTVAMVTTSSDLGEGVNLDLRVGVAEVPSLIAFFKKVKGQKVKMLRTSTTVRFETEDGSVFGFSEPSFDHVKDLRTQLDFSDTKQSILARFNLQDLGKAYKSVSASAGATSKSVILELADPGVTEIDENPVPLEIALTREGTDSKHINEAYFRGEISRLALNGLTFPFKLKLTLDQITKILAVFGSMNTPLPVAISLESPKSLRITVLDAAGTQKHLFCSFSVQ